MKKYFKRLSEKYSKNTVSEIEIKNYKDSLIAELLKMGATDSKLNLVQDETIINAIKSNWKVEEVAWAILQ